MGNGLNRISLARQQPSIVPTTVIVACIENIDHPLVRNLMGSRRISAEMREWRTQRLIRLRKRMRRSALPVGNLTDARVESVGQRPSIRFASCLNLNAFSKVSGSFWAILLLPLKSVRLDSKETDLGENLRCINP